MEEMVMDHLFNGIYKGKKVLLTGHTGFKGSWLQLWLEEMGAIVTGLSLSPNTDPAHISLLELKGISEIGDIRNATFVRDVLSKTMPDIVFHLAAQPLVRRSYSDPAETFATNILGTVNLFESIRQTVSVKTVVNVTTDKVYRNNGTDIVAYKETDILGGHDPYSTSKACVELIHESYVKSFFKKAGIKSATARAGNVIGGGDWATDRLIPDIVRAAAIGQVTDIRNPDSIRPWQHVLDPLSGYLLLGMYLLQGDSRAEGAWNFGPEVEDCLPVSEVLDLFGDYWHGISWSDKSHEVKVHESAVLRLDCNSAKDELRWHPTWNINTAIENTAEWYKAFYTDRNILTKEQLKKYVSDAAAKHAIWSA